MCVCSLEMVGKDRGQEGECQGEATCVMFLAEKAWVFEKLQKTQFSLGKRIDGDVKGCQMKLDRHKGPRELQVFS